MYIWTYVTLYLGILRISNISIIIKSHERGIIDDDDDDGGGGCGDIHIIMNAQFTCPVYKTKCYESVMV